MLSARLQPTGLTLSALLQWQSSSAERNVAERASSNDRRRLLEMTVGARFLSSSLLFLLCPFLPSRPSSPVIPCYPTPLSCLYTTFNCP